MCLPKKKSLGEFTKHAGFVRFARQLTWQAFFTVLSCGPSMRRSASCAMSDPWQLVSSGTEGLSCLALRPTLILSARALDDLPACASAIVTLLCRRGRHQDGPLGKGAAYAKPATGFPKSEARSRKPQALLRTQACMFPGAITMISNLCVSVGRKLSHPLYRSGCAKWFLTAQGSKAPEATRNASHLSARATNGRWKSLAAWGNPSMPAWDCLLPEARNPKPGGEGTDVMYRTRRHWLCAALSSPKPRGIQDSGSRPNAYML